MEFIPQQFYDEINLRISKIEKCMAEAGAEAILIASNANIYYTSGRFFRGYFYYSASSGPLWFIIKPQIFDSSENIKFIRKPEEIIQIIIDRDNKLPESIGLEEKDLSYSDVTRLKALFPDAKLVDASFIMKKARMIKTDWEIEEMKTDGRHQAKVYGEVKDCYRPGMTDLQLQIEIERRLRLEGSLGISRVAGNLMEINLGSVITGDNADNPSPYDFTMGGNGMHPSLPVGSDNSVIIHGNTVMIDMNGAFNGYQTDMTRVWSLGEISTLALQAHECSCDILRCLESFAIPGTPVKDLYEIAMGIVESQGLQQYFMGHKSQVGFIGHGVGIELNELPVINARSKDIISKNMTLAIEPKFVIPGVGAVGVENTYVVTDFGLENITIFPEEIQKLD